MISGLRPVVLCVCWMIATTCHAQAPDSVTAANPYYKTFDDYFFIGPVIKKRELIFDIISRADAKNDITYKPNNAYSLGLNLNLFDLNFEASVSVPVDIRSIDRYGKSDVKDIQLGLLSNRFVIDTYWQKYSGFFFNYPTLALPGGSPFPQRRDIDTRNMGASFAYVFNHEKFSLRSAYTFLDRQLKSKGSFILGVVVSSFDVRGDSALVSSTQHPGDLQSDIDVVRFSSLGIAPGYSYNAVVKKFFANVTLGIGPAHYWVLYHRKDGGTFYDIQINAYSNLRLAIGYNGDRFFAGVNYSAQGRNVTFEQLKVTNTISTFRFTFGFRFKESGLLKKRALDYAPAILK